MTKKEVMPLLLEGKIWNKKNEAGIIPHIWRFSEKLVRFRILQREMAIYQDHVKAGFEVHLISYGMTEEEEKLMGQYKNTYVHYNSKRLHRVYMLF